MRTTNPPSGIMPAIKFAAVFFLTLFLIAKFAGSESKPDASPEAATETIIVPQPGEEVTNEYFSHVRHNALSPCSRAIEEEAGRDFQWTSAFLGLLDRYTRYNKYQRQDGHIVMRGDDAEQKNVYGNWARVNYSCEYDPATKRVIRVDISPGQLPRIRR